MGSHYSHAAVAVRLRTLTSALDYARQRSDAIVRQWAVEGMRFWRRTSSDECYSFTEDPPIACVPRGLQHSMRIFTPAAHEVVRNSSISR